MKILTHLVIAIALLVLPAITVHANDTIQSGDFLFVKLDDTSAKLIRYAGSESQLTIPEKVGNLNVTTIEDQVFFGRTTLYGVKLPSTLRQIGDSTFMNTSLTSITIPEKVISIGKLAFYGCQLKKIIFEDSWRTLSLDDYPEKITVKETRGYSFYYHYHSPFSGNPTMDKIYVGRNIDGYGFLSIVPCNTLIVAKDVNQLQYRYKYSDITPSTKQRVIVKSTTLENTDSVFSKLFRYSYLANDGEIFNNGNFTFQANPNSTDSCKMIYYDFDANADEVAIPTTAQGESKSYKVAGIADYSLQYMSAKKLVIPEEITDLGKMQFNVYVDSLYLMSSALTQNVLASAYFYSSIIKYLHLGPNTRYVNKTFYDISSITTIVSENKYPQPATFNATVYKNANVFVPEGTLDDYKWTSGWKEFFSIKDTGVNSVAVDTTVDSDNSYYDLFGRKVHNPQKGIYIHHGRKVILK